MSGDIAAHAQGCGAAPYAHHLVSRARLDGVYIQAARPGRPRLGLPDPKPYEYGDPGRKATVEAILAAIRADADAERLLADSFDEPYRPPAATGHGSAGREARTQKRLERTRMLASLRLWDAPGDVQVPEGFVTARQAAERLGVTVRTIERYKRELRGQEAS